MFPKVKANKALKTCKRILIFTGLLRVSVVQENNPHIFTDYSVTGLRWHHTQREVSIYYQQILLFKALRFLYATQEQNSLIVLTVGLFLTAIHSSKYHTEKK